MAIKGLKELLEKHGTSALTVDQFEEELNKILPETHMPKGVYNELNDKYKMLEKQKKEVDGLLEVARTNLKDSEEFKGKYETLLAQQKEETTRHEAELASIRRDYAIESALTKAGARNTKAVKALLDDSKITLADGKYIGLDEQIAAVKKDNDFLFAEANDPTGGKGAGKPSFGNGGNGGLPTGTGTLSARIAEAMGIN